MAKLSKPTTDESNSGDDDARSEVKPAGKKPRTKAQMKQEGNAAASPMWRGLFSTGAYKRSQGRIARQVTLAAIIVLVAFGAWSLHVYLAGRVDPSVRYGVPLGVLVAGMWFGYRLVNMPGFADFLIAVEAEMNKVSWPTRTELFRSVVVVLVTIIGLAIVLWAYDVLWQVLLRALGVLGGAGSHGG